MMLDHVSPEIAAIADAARDPIITATIRRSASYGCTVAGLAAWLDGCARAYLADAAAATTAAIAVEYHADARRCTLAADHLRKHVRWPADAEVVG